MLALAFFDQVRKVLRFYGLKCVAVFVPNPDTFSIGCYPDLNLVDLLVGTCNFALGQGLVYVDPVKLLSHLHCEVLVLIENARPGEGKRASRLKSLVLANYKVVWVVESLGQRAHYRFILSLSYLELLISGVVNFVFRDLWISEDHENGGIILSGDNHSDEAIVLVQMTRQVPFFLLALLIPSITYLKVVKFIDREGGRPQCLVVSHVRK